MIEPADREFRELYGNRLTAAIEKRGISKAEAAKKAGVAISSIYHYSNAERQVSLYQAYCLAKALNVSLDWMIGYKPRPNQCVYDVIDRGYVCCRCKYTAEHDVRKYRYCPGCGAEIKYKTERI